MASRLLGLSPLLRCKVECERKTLKNFYVFSPLSFLIIDPSVNPAVCVVRWCTKGLICRLVSPLLSSSRAAIPRPLNILINDELRLDRSNINTQPRIPSAINRRPRPGGWGPPAQLGLRGNTTGNTRAHWQKLPGRPPLVSMPCSTKNAQPRRSTTLSLRYSFWVRRRRPLQLATFVPYKPRHSSLTLVFSPHPFLQAKASQVCLMYVNLLCFASSHLFRRRQKHCTKEYVQAPIQSYHNRRRECGWFIPPIPW